MATYSFVFYLNFVTLQNYDLARILNVSSYNTTGNLNNENEKLIKISFSLFIWHLYNTLMSLMFYMIKK